MRFVLVLALCLVGTAAYARERGCVSALIPFETGRASHRPAPADPMVCVRPEAQKPIDYCPVTVPVNGNEVIC